MNSIKLSLISIALMASTAMYGINAYANEILNNEIFISENGQSSYIVEFKTFGSSKTNGQKLTEDALDKIMKADMLRFMSSLSPNVSSKISHQFDFVPATVVDGIDNTALDELNNNPLVEKIYPNKIRRINLKESVNVVYPRHKSTGLDGKNWTVAILDTGVDKTHSFLRDNGRNKVISEACYSRGGYGSEFSEIDSLCPGNGAVNISSGSGRECTGYSGCDHGTHVAGIAAGSGSSFGGVASGGNLIAIQVFTGLRDVFRRNICGNGTGRNCIVAFDSDILKGLERVYALRNAYNIAAVNMSLGGGRFFSSCPGENAPMTNIIGRLKSAGIATIVASGNDGYTNSIGFPACIPAAIAVGATIDSQTVGAVDQRASYSNSSSVLDLYAPGTLIESSVPGNSFANFEGTSMAAPHVAGAFAVIKQGSPSSSVQQIENLFKSVGPGVSVSGVTRKRIDVTAVLRELGLLSSPSLAPIYNLLLD